MKPALVIFAGPPCSGKSTLGALLAKRQDIVHLEMDAFRLRLLPEAAHTREDRQVAYRGMHYAAQLLLERGHSVIVNAGYGHPEDRAEAAAVAARTGARLLLAEFTLPLEVALERAGARRGVHPGHDLTDERVTELVLSFPYTGAGVTIDSTQPVSECLERLEDYLFAGSNRPSGNKW